MQSVKGSNVLQHQQKVKDLPGGSHGWAGNFLLMAELRTKIMSFRDILDLPPCNGSIPLNEVFLLIIYLSEKCLAIIFISFHPHHI